MSAADLIDDLTSRRTHHFTTQEPTARLGSSVVAVGAALRGLQRQGLVAMLYRVFHVIVPPSIDASAACWPTNSCRSSWSIRPLLLIACTIC